MGNSNSNNNGKMPKSKRSIRNAYIKIQKTKSFRDITVTDITNEADLGRSTFYLYYEDKYDLLEEIENELIDGFLQLMLTLRDRGRDEFINGIINDDYDLFVEYFKYIKENSVAFLALLDYKSDTNFSAKFTNKIAKTRSETTKVWLLNNQKLGKRVNTPYWDTILSSTYVSLFTSWLKKGMDLSEESMGHMLTVIWRMMILSELNEHELPSDEIKKLVQKSIKML